ncbi:MAG: diguanylate cyclase [Negativicutes bacterium]|nr:diguanylate cyclase [Negativicutes bacterium]
MLTRNSAGRFWRKWISPDLALLLFCLLLLAIVWGAAFGQIERDRQSTFDAVRNDGDKFSRAFEEHVRQVLKTNDLYLALMKSEYEGAQTVTPSLRRVMTLMGQDPQVIQLALIDADGKMLESLLPYSGNLDFSGLSHFQVHVAGDSDHLFIGQPSVGRFSGVFSIHLSRRLNKPDGSFTGISYVALNPEYFTKFYQDMNFNESYAVRVIGLDGVVRASNRQEEIGIALTKGAVFRKIVESPVGFFHSPGTYFGTPRLMSYRVMPDYPLVVEVGIAEEALYPMGQRRVAYLSSAGAVSLFILVFAGRLILRSRRQRLTETRLRLSEEKYSKAFQVSPDAININKVRDGMYVEVNEGFSRMTGHSWADVAGKSSLELGIWVDCQDRDRLVAGLANHGAVENLEARYRRKDGSVFYGLTSAKGIQVAGEDCLLSIVRDITERKQAELSLEKSNEELNAAHDELIAAEEELRMKYDELLRANRELSAYEEEKTALLSAVPDLMVLYDADGIHLDYSRAADFESSVELKPSMIGQSVTDILPVELAQSFIHFIREALKTKKIQFYEYTRPVRGVQCYREVRFSRVSDTKVLAMVRDTTAIRRSEEQVKFLSMHDALTGAYNRAYFEEALLRLQAREHKSFGVFVCDVDGLKLINDTLGHRQGDELLKVIASILGLDIEQPDFAARIGGDEFAVVLFEPAKSRMEELERRYKKAVVEYNAKNPHLPLSLSIGWAVDSDVDRVFKAADNNMYRQKMHQSQSIHSAIVQTMMKALEARDHITEGHADRLGELMEKMGQKLELPQGVIADLRLFAKFHDIGKVGIPDSILNKPGKLSPEEVTVMRQHCEIGFRIARSSPDIEPIADWILKHQEHWDGNGYPLGLAGEDIPIECRVLGIIDAYDAMTSDRPYRKAMSRQDAIAELKRCAGTQFDPELVGQFIAMVDSGPAVES